MVYSVSDIIVRLDRDFADAFKAFTKFVGGEYWREAQKTVLDVNLLGHIVFANDYLETPPVYSALKATSIQGDLRDFEKRALGAFWSFVFKNYFGYRGQKSKRAGINSIKTATYFFDPPEPVLLRE
ncbi:MAG: hypothetical protein LBO66_08620 [Deltaproteobacteria bacterium]|nr:hypothetical protein [Deltaproteobacteria bacterium]